VEEEVNAFISQVDEETVDGKEKPTRKQYFATCIPGLAGVLSRELVNIGAKKVETSGTSGVYFSSDET